MPKYIAIGVDLGTSSSCCSYWDPRSKKLQVISQGTSKSTIPSTVFYSPDTNEVITGNEAVAKQPSYPKNTIFGSKRLIGLEVGDRRILKELSYGPFDLDQTKDKEIAYVIKHNGKSDIHITPTDVAASILASLKAQVEQQTGYIANEVVLSVPANFTSDQRSATLKAAKKCGLKVLRLISEPTAAALAYVEAKTALNVDSNLCDREPDYILVYDFGGGTLDCSLVKQTYNGKQEFQVLSTAGDPLLGGADLDQDLMKYCVRELSKKFSRDPSYFMNDTSKLRRLRTKCKEAKEQLSNATSVDIDLDDFHERDTFTLKLSRVSFYKQCQDTLKRALQPIKQVLEEAGVDKAKVHDVVLVGGSSRIPLIQDKLKSFFGFADISQLARTVNPDECVARGAAIYAATLTSNPEQLMESKFTGDVNSFPLTLAVRLTPDGVSPGSDKSTLIYLPLVQGHSTLPTEGKKDIEIPRKLLENIDRIDLALFQADLTNNTDPTKATAAATAEASKDKRLRLYKKWELPYFPSAPRFGDFSPYVITAHYKLDENGVLDIFFEDRELNIIIDVNANKDTTNTVVNDLNKQQQKQDLLANYSAMQQKQEDVKKAIAPPPIPQHVLEQIHQNQHLAPQENVPEPVIPRATPPPPPPQALPIHLRQNLPPMIAQQIEQQRQQDANLQAQSQEVLPPSQPKAPETILDAPSMMLPPTPPTATGPPPVPTTTNKMVEHLNQALAVRDEMIMQLQQQILSLQNTTSRQNAEIDFFKSQSQQDQEYLAYWQDQAEYSAFQLLQIQQKISNEAKSQISSVESQMQQLQTELQEKEQLLSLEQQKQLELQNYQDYQQQQQQQQNANNVSSEEVSHLQEQYDTLNGQYSALYEHYDSLAIEKETLETELQSTQLTLRDVEQKYDHQRGLYESISSQYEKCQENLISTQTSYEDYRTNMEEKLHTARELSGLKKSLEEEEADMKRKQEQLYEKEQILKQQQEQQEAMFLAQLPPLPPINQRIFDESQSNGSSSNSGPAIPFNKPKFPPPPPHLLKRQPTTASIQQPSTPGSSAPKSPPQPPKMPPKMPQFDNASPSPPQTQQSNDQHQDAVQPPQAPRPPSAAGTPSVSLPPGPPRQAFLLDIMKKPQLKKVQDSAVSSSTSETAQSTAASSSKDSDSSASTSAPAPPRLMLLSQLQQGKAMLKTATVPVEAAPSSNPKTGGAVSGMLDADLMSKISEYRKRVAMDEEEEEADFDDW